MNRLHIDWDKNYNRVFYLRLDPLSGNISIITNSNGKCKEEWSCVSYEIVETFKCNWDEIQKSLFDYKYNQIINDRQFV